MKYQIIYGKYCRSMVKRFLCFVLLVAFLFPWETLLAVSKSKKWEKVTIHRVLDNEHLLLYDRRVIKIIGIKGLDFYTKNIQDQCYARPVFRLMKSFLEDKKIKILEDETFRTRAGKYPRHVKMPDGKLLSEFLLANGMARFLSDEKNQKYDKKYEKAKIAGINNEMGIWGKCSGKKHHEIRKKSSQQFQKFRKNHGQFLAPVSVGMVKRVISGKMIELQNGIKVRLLGLEVPAVDDPRAGFACFGNSARQHLADLVQGRQVILRRDITDFDGNFVLPRYVFLPRGKYVPEIFVNQVMAVDGFAQNKWDAKDFYYKKEMEAAEDYALENGKGAWTKCLSRIKNNNIVQKKKLEFDDTCPIKGNISGSKKKPIKKYHTPASRWYKKLKYEACFNSEMEAEQAGFVKVK